MLDSFPQIISEITVGFFKESKQYDINIISPQFDQMIDEESKRERLILCKFCSNVITKPGDRIEINGKHNHTFKNPAGYLYRIGCFIKARGCNHVGEETMEFTWFPGFSWCYAICSSCFTHLGWHYQSGIKSFYGLILGKLIENI